MESGKFIVIYGANNLGKTTQAKLLIKRLRGKGKKVKYLKYPIYSLAPTGVIVDKFLRKGLNLSEYEAQWVFAQNRREYEPKLKKMLGSGYWIVAEDYKGTGICWGATHGVPLKKMIDLNSRLLEEDLGVLLDGKQFSKAIEKGHHNEDNKIWEKGRLTHKKAAKIFSWKTVNANQSVDEVEDDIWKVIRRKFNL